MSRSFLYHIFSRFCMFCALLGQLTLSGERLQDRWSSGIEIGLEILSAAIFYIPLI